jgi:hypothetical protein
MERQDLFINLLQHGIGLTQPRQRNTIIELGFNTCRGLTDTSTDGIKAVFDLITRNNRDLNVNQRVNIREQVKQRIYGARSEFLMRLQCGAEMTDDYINNLTTINIDEFVRKHNQWKEFKSAANNMALPNIDIPKLTKANWKDFSQSIKELFMRQRGTQHIPIIYVTRTRTLGVYDTPYQSTEDQLSSCLLLTGGSYRSDNSSVWSLLSQHTNGTEAESIIQRFSNTRNGRQAWLALIAHMESTSYLDNLKSSAMSSIATATYTGEKRNFGIVKYFTIHSNAHNDLETAGEPLSDGMRITHFMQGLKEDTAMNFAISSKSEANVHTFEEFYNSFSAKLTTKLTLTQPSQPNSQRHINSLNTDGQGQRNHGHHGRGGRNNYRGGGRGRGYRGRNNYRGGNGRGGGRYGGRYNGRTGQMQRWRPRLGTYTDEEWNGLSSEQRQRIFDLRNYAQSTNGNNNQNNQHRLVNQANFHDGSSVPDQVQLPPQPNEQQPSAPDSTDTSIRTRPGRTGDAFSQGTQHRQR